MIKNKKNKGSLYSRSQGALHSKGEYIIFIDSDDLVLRDGIYNSYNYMEKYSLSMIQFNTIFIRRENTSLCNRYYHYSEIIRQPILSHIFFYNEQTKKGDELNTALWDKILRRDLVRNALNFIGKDYLNKNIKIENDVILLFSLFQNAESYQYINETGYIYIRNNNDSITNTWIKSNSSNLIIHSLFLNIKFLFEKSRNTYLDKLLCVYKLEQSFKRYFPCFKKAKNEYKFIIYVLGLLLKSPFISYSDKINISNINISISHIMLLQS